jgi:uncharacterized protein (TIGR02147 family)
MDFEKPDIFEYVDYRDYLRAYYAAAKASRMKFSYRRFSKAAGFRSPNFLKLVIDGERNLGPNSVERFAKALKLDSDERRFFGHLVDFSQAVTSDEKNQAFERVSASRRFKRAHKLDGALFDYTSHWYNLAIREMAARPDFKEDPVWIARELIPPIKARQAATAMDLLFELGLLTRDADGGVIRGRSSVTSGHEVRSLALGNYHRQMLARAGESIDLVASDHRDVSALTVCIAAPTVAELKERIHRFRETLLERCDSDTEPEVVYQINIQLFPLSKPMGEGQ